jgi:hypothetical protein
MIRHATVADAIEFADHVDVRCCEEPACRVTGHPAEMARQPDGSWLCPDHHTAAQPVPITVTISVNELAGVLTCIEVADLEWENRREALEARTLYQRLFAAVQAARRQP